MNEEKSSYYCLPDSLDFEFVIFLWLYWLYLVHVVLDNSLGITRIIVLIKGIQV